MLAPGPQHRFAFGLWTVGHPGTDPFGAPVRPPLEPGEIVRRLGDLGVWGVSFHDDDLLPPGLSAAERQQRLTGFRKALDATGVVVSMGTTNLFTHPVFKEGAFTANDPEIRRYALAKVMRSIDLAAEFGAPTYVFWGGREGVEAMAAKPACEALDRYREAIDFLCGYVRDREYPMRFALEPKPNEPRGDTFLPTIGHMLAFIETLDQPAMVGVNPEVAHETMAGLSFYHGVAQALWAGKLFHIDLNAQKPGRYDQDLRFGSEEVKDAFFLVKLLEEAGYQGPRHFDARPYRTDAGEDVWEFAAGCMRTYLILADKARRFAVDGDIQAALSAAGASDLATPTVGGHTREAAEKLKATEFDPDVLADRGYHNERLDQLVMELLLGVR
ncbi:xylose isomerase [Streptomyces sp. KR80]|uniref:xylose isomerase n=1 Tax=Streptomyces sp. KR80 TaxID=3457426 RepID=UPI003FD43AB1